MKIFLTGGTGMVGKNVIEKFNNYDFSILSPSSAELNLLDGNEVNKYLSFHKPEVIIHAAGLVGGIEANIANPVDFLISNTQMGLNVVNSAIKLNIKKVVNLGSSCMYPKFANNPITEESILTGVPEETNEGYAIAKIVVAKACSYADKKYKDFFYKTIIPCNLYGKYDNFNVFGSHMIPAVIRKTHEAMTNKIKFIDMWGDGTSRREFAYVGDLVDFIFFVVKNFDKTPSLVNFGPGKDFSIMEYYESIASLIEYKGNFNRRLDKPSGVNQKCVDNQKLLDMGWNNFTPLKEGLDKTYDYFLMNKELYD